MKIAPLSIMAMSAVLVPLVHSYVWPPWFHLSSSARALIQNTECRINVVSYSVLLLLWHFLHICQKRKLSCIIFSLVQKDDEQDKYALEQLKNWIFMKKSITAIGLNPWRARSSSHFLGEKHLVVNFHQLAISLGQSLLPFATTTKHTYKILFFTPEPPFKNGRKGSHQQRLASRFKP